MRHISFKKNIFSRQEAAKTANGYSSNTLKRCTAEGIRSAFRRRMTIPGRWLPFPIRTGGAPAGWLSESAFPASGTPMPDAAPPAQAQPVDGRAVPHLTPRFPQPRPGAPEGSAGPASQPRDARSPSFSSEGNLRIWFPKCPKGRLDNLPCAARGLTPFRPPRVMKNPRKGGDFRTGGMTD